MGDRTLKVTVEDGSDVHEVEEQMTRSRVIDLVVASIASPGQDFV